MLFYGTVFAYILLFRATISAALRCQFWILDTLLFLGMRLLYKRVTAHIVKAPLVFFWFRWYKLSCHAEC